MCPVLGIALLLSEQAVLARSSLPFAVSLVACSNYFREWHICQRECRRQTLCVSVMKRIPRRGTERQVASAIEVNDAAALCDTFDPRCPWATGSCDKGMSSVAIYRALKLSVTCGSQRRPACGPRGGVRTGTPPEPFWPHFTVRRQKHLRPKTRSLAAILALLPHIFLVEYMHIYIYIVQGLY